MRSPPPPERWARSRERVRRLGDPRQWTLSAEALALLEPLGPSPELVGALAEVARRSMPSRGGPRTRSRLPTGRSSSPRSSASLVPRAPSATVAWLAPASGTQVAFATSARRSSSRPRPGRVARWPCSTTTWGGRSGTFEGPEASLEVLREGIALREGPWAHGDARRADGKLARGPRRYRRTRRGARRRRRDRSAAGSERGRMGPQRGPCRAGSDPLPAGSGGAGGRVARLARVLLQGTRIPRRTSSWASASATMGRAGVGQDEAAAALLAELEPTPAARDNQSYPALLPAMVRTALGIGDPELAERLASGLRAPHPLRRARPRRCQRRTHRGPRRPAGSRRRLRRRRRSLGAVRGRSRAGVRAPRPGPVSGRAVPTDRGRTRPAARPRDLRTAPGGARARRDRRAPATDDRAQFIGRSGQHLVKEPTVPNGTHRYSCDIRHRPSPAKVQLRRLPSHLPDTEEVRGSNPLAPTKRSDPSREQWPGPPGLAPSPPTP